VRIRNAHFKLNNMKNLTTEEKAHLLKHLNYDLQVQVSKRGAQKGNTKKGSTN